MAGTKPLQTGSGHCAPLAGAAEGPVCEAAHRVAKLAIALAGVDAAWVMIGEEIDSWSGYGAAEACGQKALGPCRDGLSALDLSLAARVRAQPIEGAPGFLAARLADPANIQGLLFRLSEDAAAAEVGQALDELLSAIIGRVAVTSAGAPAPSCEVLRELADVRNILDETCRQYALAAQLANLGIWMVDVATGAMTVSSEVRAICGIDEEMSFTIYEAIQFFDETERDAIRANVNKAISSGQGFEVEAPFMTVDGQQKWIRALCEAKIVDGVVTRLFGCMQDVTEEVTARDDIVLLASRDYLTEVANRASFTNQVENRIKQFEVGSESLFFLLIDVDHFKNINDSFGHDVGDNVLREVTRLLAHAVRTGDLVGRLGGDEFGVFVGSNYSPSLGETVAERILELAAQSPLLRSVGGGVTLSIGVADVPTRDSSFKSMLKAADLALYEAKRAGRNRVARYSQALGDEYENRERIMAAVDQALRDDAFEPWFQPKLHLKSGRLDGFEALARWRHPTRGVLTPGAFWVALEDVRMSTRISERMLERAAASVGALKRRLGRSVGRVAVNVTEKMIADPSFPERLADLALENGLLPSELELEITEAVLLSRNVAEIRASLEIMSDMGVAISLDDFGTGYASLSHLRAFPIDQLKIDMSFIRDLDTNRESRIITTAVINMAHDLQMEVVAEGVETEAAQSLLQGLKCDFVQGFYIGRPAPIDEIEALLRAEEEARAQCMLGPIVKGRDIQAAAAGR